MRPKFILVFALLVLAALGLSACSTSPGIQLTKTADPTTFSQAGDVITYTYVVQNTGDEFLENMQVTDGDIVITCPSGTESTGTLPAGIVYESRSTTCTGTYTVTATDMHNGRIETTATAKAWANAGGCSGCCGGTTMVQSTSSALVTLDEQAFGGLLLIKKAGTPTFTAVGEIVHYSYEVTNNGMAPLMGPIVVGDDRIPVTCPELPAEGLAPGDTIICGADYTITLDDVRSGSVTNIATAVSGEVRSNTDTLEITLDAQPALMLVKQVSPAGYTDAGETITYTLEITNSGNTPLAGPLTINDAMISNWQCSPDPVVELLPGGMVTCLAYFVVPGASEGSNIENHATATLKFAEEPVSDDASVILYFVPEPPPDCSVYTDPLECFQAGCHPDSHNPSVCNP